MRFYNGKTTLGDGMLDSFNKTLQQTEKQMETIQTDSKIRLNAMSYKGNSIYDYLSLTGRNPEIPSRKVFFARYFPTEPYRNLATQNLKLLDIMRKDDANGTVTKTASDVDLSYDVNQQTEAEKQAYLKKSDMTIPIFDGSAIERMDKLSQYYNNTVKAASFQNLSADEKEQVEKMVFDRAVVIANDYFVNNVSRYQMLTESISKLNNAQAVQEVNDIFNSAADFIAFYNLEYMESGNAISGLGNVLAARVPIARMSKLTRSAIEQAGTSPYFKPTGSLWRVIKYTAGGAAIGFGIAWYHFKFHVLGAEARASYWETAVEGSDKTIETVKQVINIDQNQPELKTYNYQSKYR